MTAVSEDATADLNRRIAELEQRLETALIERDAAIDRQTASALVSFRLQSELRATGDRQNASAEILHTISSAPGDAGRSLQQIAETSARLFGAPSVSIQLAKNGDWGEAYRFGDSATRVRAAVPLDTIRIGGPNLPGTVVAENRQIHLPDLDNLDPAFAHWPGPPHARAAGTRTMCGTPLRRGDEAIGVLIVYRDRLAPFTPEELALLQTFADQAVIAIENARLFNESQEALGRQTATSDILRIISRSPTDVQPVFDAIVQTAVRLLQCDRAFVMRCEGTSYVTVATAALDGSFNELGYSALIDPAANFPSRAILEKQTLYYPDWSVIELPDRERHLRETYGISCSLFLPLLRDQECIGLLALVGRQPGMFGDNEIALAESFRDQAQIAIENTRLFNETKEALERQTATADILKVIASSPSETAPVFEAIASSAKRLLGGFAAAVFRLSDGTVHLAAFTPTRPAADEALKADFPKPVDAFEPIQLTRPGEPFPIADTEEIPYTPIREIARLHGFRSMLFVPLMNGGLPIGVISVTRVEPSAFAPHHVQLLQTFADQAVIAIENARLFNETQQALERQTATADILKVIASSPSDVQPVFNAIATSAVRLLGGFSSTVFRFIDGVAHLTALTPTTPEADEILKSSFPRPVADFPPAQQAQAGETMQIADTEVAEDDLRAIARARGYRSVVFAPLTNKGVLIGLIGVTRLQPGPFADHHLQLLQTFADQAVIAIENARLFNETQQALERQTATADVLKVIASSPSDVQPVFEAIAVSANRLLGGFSCTVVRFIDGMAHLKAFTPTTPEADEVLQSGFPQPVRGFAPFQNAHDGEVTQIPDTEAMVGRILNVARARGFRSMLFAPLVNKGEPIGTIGVTRVQPGNFAEHHVQLLKTFADQAVIAIENTNLFNEVQARTLELTESLQQQTATAEVLKVISRSAFDLQAVLETLIESAVKLAGAPRGVIFLREGDLMRVQAQSGFAPPFVEFLRENPIQRGRGTFTGRAFQDGKVTHMPDVLAEPEFDFHLAPQIGGFRSALAVPLLRNGVVEGVFSIVRPEPGPFTDRQIELVQTFADQAVIAIENVRLFDEVQAKTRDLTESLQFQTATSDVLKVISRSPDALQPVLDVIVETSQELCGSDASTIFLLRDGKFHVAAVSGSLPAHLDHMKANPLPIGQPGSVLSRVYDQKRTLNYDNVLDDPEFRQGSTGLGGARALLTVPLMSEGQVIGAITSRQSHLTPFTPRQIQAIETFADQAVIAISNVNLFEQVQQRTRELSKSLDDLRTAQDRLVQTEKLASLGQLTAGIAHEIKNPLNFVNNFAALSAELTDELNDVLKPAVLDETIRAEVDELTSTLKDNLGKVVQHGKRADSIVKNMLLHSREGSGEHRPTDINALVDESLNLAYHGARAEKPHFNVTLQRNFDPEAGMIEVFPQEITRVLLNLVSNGFYAVSKRKADNGDGSFEPVVTATTKGRDDHVEIRIRDNGTGIPADVKEKMFNPFFTTKPAGEGTGLGLSMSHDIIVKQHGGTIDVDTVQGEFTEFTIVLPRTSNLSSKSRG